MKSDTDTGSMQKGAMSATGQVGRKKNGTERGGTERRRRPDTSPPAGLPLVRPWASVGPGPPTRPQGAGASSASDRSADESSQLK